MTSGFRRLSPWILGVVLLAAVPAVAQDYPPVDLYVTSWCPHCRRAREFLQAKGVPFVEYDIERDPAAAERRQRLSGRSGVPVAHIGDQVVRGFSPHSYERALREEAEAWGLGPEPTPTRAVPRKATSSRRADPRQRRWIRSYR